MRGPSVQAVAFQLRTNKWAPRQRRAEILLVTAGGRLTLCGLAAACGHMINRYGLRRRVAPLTVSPAPLPASTASTMCRINEQQAVGGLPVPLQFKAQS